MQSAGIACASIPENNCAGACELLESAVDYNERVNQCMQDFEKGLPTFALVDSGLSENEQSCVLVEKGKFYGMGYLPGDINVYEMDELKYRLTPYSENDYIRGIIYQYAKRYPGKKIDLGYELLQQSYKFLS